MKRSLQRFFICLRLLLFLLLSPSHSVESFLEELWNERSKKNTTLNDREANTKRWICQVFRRCDIWIVSVCSHLNFMVLSISVWSWRLRENFSCWSFERWWYQYQYKAEIIYFSVHSIDKPNCTLFDGHLEWWPWKYQMYWAMTTE